MDRKLLSRRASTLVATVVVVAALGVLPNAHAAPPPPAVALVPAADGFVNAAEAVAADVSGTYAPIDGSVTHVRATISVAGDATCPVVGAAGVDYLDPVDVPVDGVSGVWSHTFDVTALPEGATLCARAVAFDGAYSGVGASPEQGVLDTIAPAAGTVEMIDDDGYLTQAQATILCCIPANWANADPEAASSTVWFRDADGAMTAGCGTWTLSPTGFGAVNASCAASMAEGSFDFVGTWADAAGNTSPEATATLIKDTLGPLVTITAPADESASPASLSLTGTTEPGAPLAIEVDGVPVFSGAAGEDGSFAHALTLPDGAHTLEVLAEDELGNVGSASVDVTVDSLIPVIVSPEADSHHGGVLALSGTGRPGSKVEIVEGAVLVATAQVDATGDWTVSAAFPTGTHTIRARGIASGGAPVSPYGPLLTFSNDAGAPTVVLGTADLTPFVVDPPVIEGTATDGLGVAKVSLEYFNTLLGAKVLAADATCATCGPEAASVAWTHEPDLLPGTYTVYATAVDTAGNRSAAQTARIIVVGV